ncbi:hypothetical protein ACSYGO_46015, partial [Streptomyces krungchingensis]
TPAQSVSLRIDPEDAYRRRGIEAATRWLRETGSTELRVPYVLTAPEGGRRLRVSAGAVAGGCPTLLQDRHP